jgi:hypothetical protein
MPDEIGRIKIKIGDTITWQKDKMMALKWCDKKEVYLLTTIYDTKTRQVTLKSGKKISKPVAIIEYNNFMGGVDASDQGTASYPLMRKQQKKFYIKIFRHLLELCL